ncbi:polysaccharide deacetylase family protein [Aquibacillus salsiterrae]|uniref:Polysaccharide deacetylase family protein n=1 Tax=Aquibacillus salsiterrae TaxID=2950439 RepID=A0A9X3WE17_9BACI|nr:polysaccharide deacetylase family protein [Aquibacillus salsiterrae]MDC3417987.1 polysaccharide deacetylase family protein [Aquibacillus salsiterrae]
MVDQSRVVYDSKDENVLTKIKGTRDKTVVLTFDDGPSKLLPNLLNILKEEQVPAVFFWQSRLLYPKRPWQRLLEEGHHIGSHTINHPDLTRLSYQEQLKQLKVSVSEIETITGQKVNFFRPPFGQYNDDTIKAAKALGLTTVMWRIAAIDWELKCDPEQIITNVIDHLEDGAIILLHELAQTIEVLPTIIQSIKSKGYSFTTL